MPETPRPEDVRSPAGRLVADAAAALQARREEVDRLNVFPVPDGDTGTNMSLTMDSVIAELAKLPATATASDVCKAVTHGSLMGARGNSGVILSQVLRGLCDTADGADTLDAATIAEALAGAERTAYQAVRKPVEGTMLTVVKDTARAARKASRQGGSADEVLEVAVAEVFASVRRTPELLPVLKEAGVVDAGALGLAILAEGFVSAFQGRELAAIDTSIQAQADVEALANDWDDQDHLYCTELLIYGRDLDRDVIEEWMAEQGGSQLVVGDPELLKVHVHVDDPASVIAYATSLGEVAEVHINNMRRQSVARAEQLAAGHGGAPSKPLGFVAVASGEGLQKILTSLGADQVVSGGQTMNPSTADLLAAVEQVDAANVIVLPNNGNIIMTAQQVVGVATRPVGVVPTKSVPESFAALLAADPDSGLEENVAAMTAAAEGVRAGEVTWAVKDSRSSAGDIKAGDVIGIADHEIRVVGSDVLDVSARLADALSDGSGETLTLLAGEQLSDEDLGTLAERTAEAHPDLEVEALRGDQPLYPLIMSVE